jgi:hypothetical protein
MKYESFTVNLLPKGCRYDILEDRKHLVAPMVILTEGVHHGSCGPLYYPKEELAKTPAAWNHKPIVVYHPTMNGLAISACDPVVLNSRKVGVMLNTRYQDGKLKSEAWIDISRVDKVDERIMEFIRNGEIMELSTGVFIDIEEKEGEWNGEKYIGIARNFRPDHLALLPDQIGACSVADGAGLLRNADGRGTKIQTLIFSKEEFTKEQAIAWAKEHGFSADKVDETEDSYRIRQVDPSEFKEGSFRTITLKKGVKAVIGIPANNSATEISDNEEAYYSLMTRIQEALGSNAQVKDFLDNQVIFLAENKLYRQPFQVKEDGTVSLLEEKVEVKQVTTYVDVTNEVKKKEEDGYHPASHYLVVEDPEKPSTWHLRVRDVDGKLNHRLMGAAWAALHGGYRGNKYEGPNKREAIAKLKKLYEQEGMEPPATQQRTTMKEELIQKIIGKNAGWKEEDRESLSALNENQLTLILNALDRPKEPEKPATLQEYIAAAPKEIQEVLNSSLAVYQEEKNRLVETILKNEQNEFTKEELESRPLGELRRLAKLAAKPTRPNYSGQAPVPAPAATEEEPLIPLSLSFSK